MTINGWIQIALYCVILIALTKPFGGYLARVFNGERTVLSPVLGWLERGVYRLSGVDPAEEQHWLTYGLAMFAFTVAGFLVLYAIQRLQGDHDGTGLFALHANCLSCACAIPASGKSPVS